MQFAGVSHLPTSCNKSVRCCLIVYREQSRCMASKIAWLSDINITLFEGQDVCWCLSQINPGILHETDANNQVMLYCLPSYSQCIDSQKADFALFKVIKHTNLDINEAACLHIVHILQHQTSHPTTKSPQTAMVNALNKNFSPVPVGQDCKSTKWSTQRGNQVNDGKSGLDADRVQALGALHSLRSKMKLPAEK